MSCNGCRILRKGCNDNCILRQSLQAIDSPDAQANATLFVAKFFGRAGLISFLSSVPQSQRPALFQSLLFEACGRTVNPVSGSVGLLWTGNWHACQSAVETVLRGGVPRALPEFEEAPEENNSELYGSSDLNARLERKGLIDIEPQSPADFRARMTSRGRVSHRRNETRRHSPPSDGSETTTLESGLGCLEQNNGTQKKLLQLFF